jgi:hypothetical protein
LRLRSRLFISKPRGGSFLVFDFAVTVGCHLPSVDTLCWIWIMNKGTERA